jgi:hypothetical protein
METLGSRRSLMIAEPQPAMKKLIAFVALANESTFVSPVGGDCYSA